MGDHPEGFESLYDQVSKLADLEAGWHQEYGGAAISRAALEGALEVAQQVQHSEIAHLVHPCPTPEGGIAFVWERDNHSRCIELLPNGQSWFISLNTATGRSDVAERIQPNAPDLVARILKN